MKELTLLACEGMELSFSATMPDENGNSTSIVVDIKYSIITQPDSRMMTGDGKGFYFGAISLQASDISCIVGGNKFTNNEIPVDFIINPSAKHVSRIQDDSKALLHGDTSSSTPVTLYDTTKIPPLIIDIAITAKVEEPGQQSVWGS